MTDIWLKHRLSGEATKKKEKKNTGKWIILYLNFSSKHKGDLSDEEEQRKNKKMHLFLLLLTPRQFVSIT